VRTFTLVIGTFDLEVEESEKREDGSRNYSAKCEEVGFSVDRYCFIESLLFPFCKYLANKHLKHEWSPSKLVYRGFTLELSHQEHPSIYLGSCKEIEFDDNDCFDELVDTFIEKVDEHLENTMNITHKGYELIVSKYNHALFNGECKELGYYVPAVSLSFLMEDFPKFVDKKRINQFSVVYNDFTLEVWQEREKVTKTLLWFGKCEAINFKEDSGLHYLDTLVGFFQGAVDEYSRPTKIEYKGYELEITHSNGESEGKSDISGGFNLVLHSKEEVIEAFKRRVDSLIQLRINCLETSIADKQGELEDYLRKLGYVFDTVILHRHPFQSSLLYAIHPECWDNWRKGVKDLPEGKVIFIKQQ